MRYYQIQAPHFCAGLGVGAADLVKECAPILAYMHGWQLERVRDYCREKDWQLIRVLVRQGPVSHG